MFHLDTQSSRLVSVPTSSFLVEQFHRDRPNSKQICELYKACVSEGCGVERMDTNFGKQLRNNKLSKPHKFRCGP